MNITSNVVSVENDTVIVTELSPTLSFVCIDIATDATLESSMHFDRMSNNFGEKAPGNRQSS